MRKPAVLVAFLLWTFVPPTAPAASLYLPHTKKQKVSVPFLARSTSIRSSWGGNQDVYLVEITGTKGEQPVFAKLVDDFLDEDTAVPQDVLDANKPVRLTVRRWHECDLSYADFRPHLILMDYGGFAFKSPPAGESLPAIASDTRIPCYRTQHKDIDRLASR